MTNKLLTIVALLLTCWTAACRAAPLTLIGRGGSAYCIYHDSDAPASVKTAALELQRILKAATGIELPIRNEVTSPMICLGDNPVAHEAAISTSSARTHPTGRRLRGTDSVGERSSGFTSFLRELSACAG